MSGHYKIDMTRVNCREAWRFGGLGYVLLVILWKMLGTKCYSTTLIPDEPGILRLDPEQIPMELRETIAKPASELEAAEFSLAFYYTAITVGVDQAFAWTGLHRSGETIATISSVKHHPRRQVSIVLVSRLENDGLVATGNTKLMFDPPPSVDSLRLVGHAESTLVKRHLQRVEHLPVKRISIDDVEGIIVEAQRLILEHNLRRGLYVPA